MDKSLENIGIKEVLFNKVHLYHGERFSDTLIDFSTIFCCLKKHAENRGDDPFIIETINEKEVQIITYKVFYTTLLKVAFILKNSYDIQLDSKVAILPRNTVSSVYIILGVMLCGGTAVIINPNEPENRILQQIETIHPSLITIDDLNTNLKISQSVTTEHILKQTNDSTNLFESIKYNFYSPALIIFTTGSTSTSKPVMQTHYNIAINGYALVKHHQLDCHQRLICVLPICHVNGLEFTIFSSMIAGSSVILCDSFDPFIYLKLIEKYRVTLASLVPPMLDSLVEENAQISNLSSLRYFVTAAASLSHKTANLIWEKFNKRIIQGYGLTETTNFSTLLPVNLNQAAYQALMLDCDIPSVGQEVFGNEVTLLNNDGSLVEEGKEGEICMRGHNVMIGYLNNSAATKECFKGGWFHSGDIGKFVSLSSSYGKFLIITGRIKNIIQVCGHAVSLDEIDREILNIEGVKDVVTCAINDVSLGEIPLSFVVKSYDLLTEAEIIDILSKNLHHQSLPRQIFFVPKIPRMKNGKVNRSSILKELLQNV